MHYQLPDDLADATMIELPSTWTLVVRCGSPCSHAHIWTVDRLIRRFGWGLTPRLLAARSRCRHCGRRPTSMLLEEAAPPGVELDWTPQKAVITFSEPPPLPPPGPDDIDVDWSAPLPRRPGVLR